MFLRLRSVGLIVLLTGLLVVYSHAAGKLAVGIVPFDVMSVSGAAVSSGEAMAKLVRIEMVKSAKLQPSVLPKASSNEEAAKAGAAANSDIVVVGTVLSADTSASNRSANSGLLGGALGVGGNIQRVTTSVVMHIELVSPKTGDLVDTFEVEAKNSGTSVGTDFSTALGNLDNGDTAFDQSTIGKALREAAQKVTVEVVKRSDKLTK